MKMYKYLFIILIISVFAFISCIKTSEPPNGMIFVKGGKFRVQSYVEEASEKSVHSVKLDGYYIGKYEVTDAEYIEFLNEKGVKSEGSFKGVEYIDMDCDNCPIGYKNDSFYFKGGKYTNNKECPVVGVTWYGADAYCKWKGGRLPTEAEWEYAARGGNKSQRYEYSGSNNPDKVAWYWKNSGDKKISGDSEISKILTNNCRTHAVGKKKPNELGIYDMSGNVWEWCKDWYDHHYWDDEDHYQSYPRHNPKGPENGSYRVLRGGSWFRGTFFLLVDTRISSDPTVSDLNIGFRCVVP